MDAEEQRRRAQENAARNAAAERRAQQQQSEFNAQMARERAERQREMREGDLTRARYEARTRTERALEESDSTRTYVDLGRLNSEAMHTAANEVADSLRAKGFKVEVREEKRSVPDSPGSGMGSYVGHHGSHEETSTSLIISSEQ